MQQCSTTDEALVSLFHNLSTSFLLLFLFVYLTSFFLAKFFIYVGGNPFLHRNQDGYEHAVFSDEEEEEEETEYCQSEPRKKIHLDSDVAPHCDESPSFLHDGDSFLSGEFVSGRAEETNECFGTADKRSTYRSPTSDSEGVCDSCDEESVDQEILAEEEDAYSAYDSDDDGGPRSHVKVDPTGNENCNHDDESGGRRTEANFTRDDRFLIFSPPESQNKKHPVELKDSNYEEISQDSCTVGSTSKSSSEWRSSIHYKDSGTEDPFSSSSRRSCPKWESYTIFQKYDEEMLFLDRISAQKLHETESFRSIKYCPRSISERIVHKLAPRNNATSDFGRNPYHELEAAYVAQICLTWEALNWNYQYFKRVRATLRELHTGCPAYVAQQFQQFQVLLQRYIENEPYEHGRRPEIYSRMRCFAPKLLHVPEYRDTADEKVEKEGYSSRIPSVSFILMMEESIRTFMNFLKADKENQCQKLKSFFKRKRRAFVDPTHLLIVKSTNKKKKAKVKDIRRAQNCLRRRRLSEEEEMEILMALVDLKVVSRVLRMRELNEEQLRWCEDKMNKVRVADGKLRRDSTPLFFPAH